MVLASERVHLESCEAETHEARQHPIVPGFFNSFLQFLEFKRRWVCRYHQLLMAPNSRIFTCSKRAFLHLCVLLVEMDWKRIPCFFGLKELTMNEVILLFQGKQIFVVLLLKAKNLTLAGF